MATAVDTTRARWIGEDVLARAGAAPRAGSVIGRFDGAVHVELDDFVVAILAPPAPRVPNGVGGPAGLDPRAVAPGDRAILTRDGLVAGALGLGWDPDRPPRWDSRVGVWPPGCGPRLDQRARAIVGAGAREDATAVATAVFAGIDGFGDRDHGAGEALAALAAAVTSADRTLAAEAGRRLAGRGSGQTPVGDDVLAAAALTVAAAGSATRFAGVRRRAWLSALVPVDLRRRTTSISATILELARSGRGIGPALEILTPEPVGSRELAAALRRLRDLGHTTGPAYAAAIGAVALLLASREAERLSTNSKERRLR